MNRMQRVGSVASNCNRFRDQWKHFGDWGKGDTIKRTTSRCKLMINVLFSL